CYVSRGDNTSALLRAVRGSIEALESVSVNYRIEIVTDKPVAPILTAALQRNDLIFNVVPSSYETPHHTRFKARALQYALERRTPVPEPYNWILHLDEESMVTPSAIAGVH